MSTIAERARNEADEAEREDEEGAKVETPEPEPDDGDDTEPEPEPEPVTEARFTKIERQIAGEDTRHEKRLREIYGDLWGEREVCPLCMQEGFIVPTGPEGFDPEHRMVVLAAMGEGAPVTFKPHPDLAMCPECDGLGFLATGSKRDGFTDQSCPRCTGNGWINPKMEPSAQPPYVPAPLYELPAPGPNGTAVNADSWGRPAGHPHWGQNPADVGIPL